MDRRIQPQIKELNLNHINKPESLKLFGIVPTYLFRNDSNVINFRFIFNVGSFTQDFPLQCVFTSKMLSEGTQSYSSTHIAETFDYYGVKYYSETTNDSSSIVLIANKKHLSKIFPVFAEVLLKPIFPENELKTALNISYRHFLLELEKVTTLAKQKFDSVVFGESNYYGYSLKNEDFTKLKSYHLSTFHKQFITAANCKLVITGNMSDADLISFEKSLTGFNYGNDAFFHTKQNFKSSKGMKHYVPKTNALQSAIEMGRLCPKRGEEDDMGFRVLNTALGGYFGSRLMANIRENKGYTYGIYSVIFSMRHAAYFSIKTQVGKDVCKPAIKEIYNELQKLQNEKIKKNELELVKNYLLGSILRSIDGHVNLANLFASLIVYDIDLSYIERYINEIRNIDNEKLLCLAQKYFPTEHLFEIVAG
ncbi:MAG: pitrilysin family protein [Bacteroidales bacterium]|nr:pitrilysin family protein [Bacteroidales bacterium]